MKWRTNSVTKIQSPIINYTLSLLAVLLLAPLSAAHAVDDSNNFPVSIRIEVSKSLGELNPVWRFFGADEPNYAYMEDGRKLLGELGKLGKPQVFFRAHHLLTSGDGAYALKFGSTSAYKEDEKGRAIYDWTINDRIFDAYLAAGIKPFVEIGFMPEALSTHPQDYPRQPNVKSTVKADAGQSYPPKDYAKWGELCFQWAKHCVERYGRAEVEQWYWEVWNEPNYLYWKGTNEEFFKLHDFAIDGVRRALPTARVGGPHTSSGPGGTFLYEFLEHCARGTNHATGEIGTPLDFIATHAKGKPQYVDGRILMSMAPQLQELVDTFAVVSSFPQYKNTSLIIGEFDPEGCAACRRPQDVYRNGTMYSSYTAASFPRTLELARTYGVNLEGVLSWSFTFEDQPPFAGFRQLASAGIDHPVLNVFRMFGKMSGQQLPVTSSGGLTADQIRTANVRGTPDVSAQASLDGNQIAVLVWHYHDDDVKGPSASVSLSLDGIPLKDGEAKLTHYRVDADHSNAYEAWKSIGSPEAITAEQRVGLEKAGQLAELHAPAAIVIKDGKADLKLDVPRQAVSLLVLSWK
jgi:xylan 1,4-beta-xylosidase